jgi:DNA-binding transcriptional LysR family regulator
MLIDSDRVAAFSVLAQTGNFTRAAQVLGLSQPALSKKIQTLEAELSLALLIRDKKRFQLTPAGQELLRYWKARGQLDADLFTRLGLRPGTPLGELRVAGFSTITHSLVLPLIARLSRRYPDLPVTLLTRETYELEELLLRGEADVVLSDRPLVRERIRSELIGHEEQVHVTPMTADKNLPFIDHDPKDEVTFSFLRAQGLSTNVRRIFMDDIQGVIRGVELGLGQAILSRHLLKGLRVSQRNHKKRVTSPVYLSFHEVDYSPVVQLQFLKLLRAELPKLLS